MKGTKTRLGDIIEIRTPKGLAYAQYTHKNAEYGHLIRVLPGLFDSRPENFETLANTKELYFVFFPLAAAVSRGLVAIVSNENIPVWAQKLPFMRRAGGLTPGGKVLNWWLWDGEKEWRVDKLNEEQKKLSIAEIWNDTLLIQRICEGWLPTQEY
jgi:hypothetical protein